MKSSWAAGWDLWTWETPIRISWSQGIFEGFGGVSGERTELVVGCRVDAGRTGDCRFCGGEVLSGMTGMSERGGCRLDVRALGWLLGGSMYWLETKSDGVASIKTQHERDGIELSCFSLFLELLCYWEHRSSGTRYEAPGLPYGETWRY